MCDFKNFFFYNLNTIEVQNLNDAIVRVNVYQ